MARAPAKLPDGSAWVGKRVRYVGRNEARKNFEGTVIRMASSRHPSMYVQFGDQTIDNPPLLTYASDLERI